MSNSNESQPEGNASTPEKTGRPPYGLPSLSPDYFEEQFPDEIDNIVPTRGYSMLPLVGIGGSAGSIQALQTFFTKLPVESGMAFVVILHLAPDVDSILPELLGRCTRMPVCSAQDGMEVAANHVYVIPPGKHLTVTDDHLKLSQLEPERGKRVAVDLFFRSLADTHGAHAAAIVLSGADGDGAIGIKRIKERGGLTIAQDPDEAEHSSMPRSAVATGMIDWVLPVDEMPGRLIEYYAGEKRLIVPPEEGPPPSRDVVPGTEDGEAALREVIAFLRSRTGHDFSYYKRATIVRRISRRMQINEITDLPTYLGFIRTHQGESAALLQDLLISVTNFFRDRDAFARLGDLIPELFRDKKSGDFIRVWVPACATGEEAYSIAMLLLEYARTLDAPPTLQVFGCDLDESAVQAARNGFYPDAVSADVSEDRLRRFFTKERSGYRVRRELREMILFAAHDLLKDAPFSRLDLISCRNLMIYLNRDAQRRALEIFHFALRPHSLLLLGSSESVDEDSPLFRPRDKKFRIYEQQPTSRMRLPVPTGTTIVMRALELQSLGGSGLVLPGPSFDLPGAPPPKSAGQVSLAELHVRLVERMAAPSVLVNADYDIIHLSEHAGAFLHLGGGAATLNLLRAVHPLLRVELRGALLQARDLGTAVEVPPLPLEIGDETRAVGIRVEPAMDMAPGYLLVIFETKSLSGEALQQQLLRQPEPVAQQLERELDLMRSRLRDTVEQYEANTEELKASNEELQSMNEELRSASEELETSREELQSINEELTTVNLELKCKVDELGHSNSDLHNLMASTAIATIFLDRELQIMRFTPSAVDIFNLIPSDIGRPLSDLRHRLDFPQLREDARKVLDDLVPIEREVPAVDGRAFLSRLLPYRTLDDRIAGIVLTFIDITERRRAEETLRQRNDELERFNRAAVGREQRMIELKKEINAMAESMGRPPPYIVNESDSGNGR